MNGRGAKGQGTAAGHPPQLPNRDTLVTEMRWWLHQGSGRHWSPLLLYVYDPVSLPRNGHLRYLAHIIFLMMHFSLQDDWSKKRTWHAEDSGRYN